jgi:hypothetical protein
MANYYAITAVTQAVIYLLRSSYENHTFEDFDGELEFDVYTAARFSQPMEAGVSLFLYRIVPNGHHRTPAGRLSPNGERYQTRLPLDLHFLLTAWGGSASVEQTIAGWLMRTLADTPILPVGLLNRVMPGVFQADESVELILDEMKTEDLLHLWETLPSANYQLSIPYLARSVRIESAQMLSRGEPVQERAFDYRKVNDEPPA